MSARLRAMARETVEAAEKGVYQNGDGTEVLIGDAVAQAVAGTRLYLPDEPLTIDAKTTTATVEVTNESTLEAVRRLDGDLACLVFASARNPGGGFLNGAQAQEESLARGSALYPCLLAAKDFYAHHRAHAELTYSDRVIYSPGVPVFRDDDGHWLDEPRLVSFLTCAAPNRSAIESNQPDYLDKVPEILVRRATRVLSVAAWHGHRRLVLGAWGCGVFGNDPSTVAGAFGEALKRCPWFEYVLFAVLDRTRDQRVIAAFTRTFPR